jgi:hypothetical protein
LLKGESLLQLGQNRYAADAFEEAARHAGEPRLAATARANALLVRKATGHTYKPGGGGAGGTRGAAKALDIRPAQSRKEAFAALHDDLAGVVRPRVQKAMSARSLPPMADVLPDLLDLAALEFAAKGSAEDARAMLTELGAHARRLMSDEVRRVDYRVGDLHSTANSFELVTSGA